MKNLISSFFFHEVKNSLASIKLGIEMFEKYEFSPEEKREFLNEILTTINETIFILEQYLEFVKFQFNKKLKYEYVDIYPLLEEIKQELSSFANSKGINIYIKHIDYKIYTNKFWLKRAIYNIVYNAIKYNKKYGSVNIKMENSVFGLYILIQDTGIGIETKKLKSIFKVFERVDEKQKGFGIGLALAKSVIDSFGGSIKVKSNQNIGSEFLIYIPKKPKEVTLKNIAKGILPASILLFFGISYFPIYSQKYEKISNGGYVSYVLEDGSVLKFSKNSDYEISLKKNLYNTNYKLYSKLNQGDVSLKAIKQKANIKVDDRDFQNLGTDFEIIKDDNTKVAVFSGAIKSKTLKVKKSQGVVISDEVKVVKLLDKVENIKIKNNILYFKKNPKAVKYKVLVSNNSNFGDILATYVTTTNQIQLNFNEDNLYFIKIFAFDKYGLPSLPNVIKYISLDHYKKAKRLLNSDLNEAILELQTSISTISNYSNLPYFELAKIYFNQKKYNQSLKLIKKAIQILPIKEEYYLLLDIYQKLNKYNQIQQKIDTILKKYPNDDKFLYFKAIILYQKQDYKKASEILFKIIENNPDNKKVNLLLSKVLFKMGKVDLANYYKKESE